MAQTTKRGPVYQRFNSDLYLLVECLRNVIDILKMHLYHL